MIVAHFAQSHRPPSTRAPQGCARARTDARAHARTQPRHAHIHTDHACAQGLHRKDARADASAPQGCAHADSASGRMRAKPRHAHTYRSRSRSRTHAHALTTRTHKTHTHTTHTHNTHAHTTHTHTPHTRTHARGAPRRRRRWTWRASARTSSTRSCRPGQNILVKILVKSTGQTTGQIQSEGQPAHLPRARAALPPTANRSK